MRVYVEIKCDGCGAKPLTGCRYRCVICPDFDICENCEDKEIHAEHPMVRFRQSTQAHIKSWPRVNELFKETESEWSS